MHCLNSVPGAAGLHSPPVTQCLNPSPAEQARANVVEVGGGLTLGGSMGRHPLCFIVSGAIVIDCTQGTSPQSCPAGIAFSAVQVPVQLAGGSNDR